VITSKVATVFARACRLGCAGIVGKDRSVLIDRAEQDLHQDKASMRADRQLFSIVFLRLVAAAPRARAVAAPKSLSSASSQRSSWEFFKTS